MNRIPPPAAPARLRNVRLAGLLALALLAAAWLTAASPADDRVYRLDYTITLDPEAGGARIALRLRQPGRYLREVDMSTLDGRLSDFSGDGELSVDGDRVEWLPPAEGGTLRWFARLDHRRAGDGYDARTGRDWALFRGEDVIPSATTRTLKGATGETSMSFELPRRWSVVTPYRERDGQFRVDNPERRFDTPTGWIVAGDLGVRIETIEDVRVVVAGPVGQDVRRLDILALLQWTLPDLVRLLPDFPERLTIVSAGDPMWRGALSAPRSLYVHADRPLLSGNATSTLVHEAVHVGLGLSDAPGADWIVEGLAEYYSLEILRRSGTISDKRYHAAHRDLAAWAREADSLCGRHSNGSSTALAVTVMAALDAEIRRRTKGSSGLDEVVRALSDHDGEVSVADFRDVAARVAGGEPAVLGSEHLRGCD